MPPRLTMVATRDTLILLGAPGAGKGTQGRLVADALGAVHISVGDLVRAARARGERLPADRRTRLLDTAATLRLIGEAMAAAPGATFVLDGFPRAAGQVRALADLPARVGAVVWLEVDFPEAIARMKGRSREGEDIAQIALRHDRHEQAKGPLRAALKEAGIPVVDVDANPPPGAVLEAILQVIHSRGE